MHNNCNNEYTLSLVIITYKIAEDEPLNFGENIHISQSNEQTGDVGDTLAIVTKSEMLALLVHRKKQIDNGGFIHPKIIENYPNATGTDLLLFFELIDTTIDYPLSIVRYGKTLRVHTDLVLLKEISNQIMFTDDDGRVSYDDNHTCDPLAVQKNVIKQSEYRLRTSSRLVNPNI